MKGVKFFYTALLLSVCSISLQCTPNNDLLTTEKMLVRNVWSVDYYFNGQNITSEFSNARLLFSSTGSVGYQTNGETVPGTWNRTVDASDKETITVHFNTTDSSINKLSQAWSVSGRYADALEFEENSGSTPLQMHFKIQ
jgi:hypothetical protein